MLTFLKVGLCSVSTASILVGASACAQDFAQTPTLTLQDARAMIGSASNAASAAGVAVSIAVLDDGGHVIALERMEGAPYASVQLAEQKAQTALAARVATADLQTALRAGAAELSTARDLLLVAGGVPVRAGASFPGSIGVSGAAPEQDDAIARAGLRAIER